MIDTVLAGAGKPAATPISPYLSQWYDPNATFRYDPAAAGRLLDEAGWTAGPDGRRSRNGEPARLPILYLSHLRAARQVERAGPADRAARPRATARAVVEPRQMDPEAILMTNRLMTTALS